MPDIHASFPPPEAEEIVAMERRMLAYIFPGTPRGAAELAAFSQAVLCQIAHEKTLAAGTGGSPAPAGVESFTIGHFSMRMEPGAANPRLTPKTLCPQAYGILLRAGLLYRGVEGRDREWA